MHVFMVVGDSSAFSVNLAMEEPLPDAVQIDRWEFQLENFVTTPIEEIKLEEQGIWTFRTGHTINLKGRTLGRLQSFNELKYTWNVETDSKTI